MTSLLGDASLISGTMKAAATMIRNSTSPVWNERWRSSRRSGSQRAERKREGAAAGAQPMVAALSATVVPHARIEPGIGDVDEDVDHDQQQCCEEKTALNHRIVAVENGGGEK